MGYSPWGHKESDMTKWFSPFTPAPLGSRARHVGKETFNLEAKQVVQTYFLMICLKSPVLFALRLRNRVDEATFGLAVCIHISERREKD